jgi:hypothetical protein
VLVLVVELGERLHGALQTGEGAGELQNRFADIATGGDLVEERFPRHVIGQVLLAPTEQAS